MSGRIRTIKPELLEDERTAGLSHVGLRLFVSLLLLADDYGNGRAHTKLLDGAVFWARPAGVDVESVIQELAGSGLIHLYAVRGQRYFHVAGWEKHQRVDKPGKPRCPKPEESDSGPIRDSLANDSGTHRGGLAPDPDPDQRPREGEDARATPLSRMREAEGITPLPAEFVLTPERKAYAEQSTVTGVDAVFRKFQQIAVERRWMFDANGWEARWKRFCDDEKNYQRREREQGRGVSPAVASNPYDSPAIRTERQRRERDRRHTEKNAVPAPIGDLMAAIGRKT